MVRSEVGGACSEKSPLAGGFDPVRHGENPLLEPPFLTQSAVDISLVYRHEIVAVRREV